jgi:hypothetical protein
MESLLWGDTLRPRKTFRRGRPAAPHLLRGFAPPGGIEVSTAALEIGVLKRDLVRRQVQPSLRTVEIKTGGS